MAGHWCAVAGLVLVGALTGCSPTTPEVTSDRRSEQQAVAAAQPTPRAEPAGRRAEAAEEPRGNRCPKDPAGFPKIRLRPSAGPIGTRIGIRIPDGCFTRDWNAGYGVFLLRQFMRPRECELIGAGGYRLHVNAAGGARGYVIAPARGHCFQQPYGRAATPAHYSVGFGCHACGGPTFTITRKP